MKKTGSDFMSESGFLYQDLTPDNKHTPTESVIGDVAEQISPLQRLPMTSRENLASITKSLLLL